MQGFEGPFEFDIDSEGTKMSWDHLPEPIKEELTEDGHFTSENSNIWLCKVVSLSTNIAKQRHHDWARVNRVFIDVKPSSKHIKIFGIYPEQVKSIQIHQEELNLPSSFEGQVSLFEALRFKLKISDTVKLWSAKNRYAVLGNCIHGHAQWVYSSGWDKTYFKMYLYIVVQNNLPESDRNIFVTIKPTRKGNKVLSQVCIWERKISLC